MILAFFLGVVQLKVQPSNVSDGVFLGCSLALRHPGPEEDDVDGGLICSLAQGCCGISSASTSSHPSPNFRASVHDITSPNDL